MSEVYEPICVERILVSLDSSKHSFAALKVAVDLARHYDATLNGVFVEDVALLGLAEMPFRQEVGEYTAIVREISTDGITRGIYVQSRWVIRTFQKLINQTDLVGDFAILRGNVIETIQKESSKCDLLIIGKGGTSPFSRYKLGSTTRAMIDQHQKSLVLVEEGNRLGNPLILLYDNSPIGQVSLETAGDLLGPDNNLVVLISDEDSKTFTQAKEDVHHWAAANNLNITIQKYTYRTFARFIQRIKGLKEGLFILPRVTGMEKRQFVEYCLENVSLPILLVRTKIEEDC